MPEDLPGPSVDDLDSYIHINFSDVEIDDFVGDISLAVGSRPISDLIFNPNHFPMCIDGVEIDLHVLFKEEETKMTVARADDSTEFTTMDITEMDKHQQYIALLYMIGVVLDGSN